MTEKALRNTIVPLQVTFSLGETPTDPDNNSATVTITAENGTAIVTGATATRIGPGLFTYNLAPQTDLGRLTAQWTATFATQAQTLTTITEIVGGFYVSLSQIRTLAGLTDEGLYPADVLTEARNWIEAVIENACGVAFVPRYARDVIDGDSTWRLGLSHHRIRRVIWSKVNGVLVDTSSWDVYGSGKIIGDRWFDAGGRNVEVAYEHGYDEPDAAIIHAALTAIRMRILGDSSGIPERAVSMSIEGAQFGLSLAGANRPTGIPEVDAVIASHSERVPLVG